MTLVLLDVNETLVSFDALRPRFPRAEMVELWLASVLRDGCALAAAGSYASFAELGEQVARAMLGGDAEAARQVTEGIGDCRLHGDVVAGLAALAERGARLVTFTNGSRDQTRRWLEQGGAAEHVDAFESVEDVRLWKPRPEAYRWALERCGIEAADTVMLAVHPWDLHGARQVGIRGAWLNRHGAPWPDAFDAPEWNARHLPALAELLPI